MRRSSSFFVYILASRNRVLYVGVTNDLERRLFEHRCGGDEDAFTARYRVGKLVYVEEFDSILDALRREKQIKGWRRDRKVALIEAENPDWVDLMGEG